MGLLRFYFLLLPPAFFSTKLQYNGGVFGLEMELLGVRAGRNFRVIPRSKLGKKKDLTSSKSDDARS